MNSDPNVIWENCLKVIRDNISSHSFKTWFEPIKPVKVSNDALTIRVPDKIFYDWIEEHYVSILKMAIRNELGEKGKLHYQIFDKKTKIPKPTATKFTESTSQANIIEKKAPEIKNPFIVPGIKKIRVESNLNPRHLFDTFIEGDCNQLARSASQAIAQNPGKTSFNPLFIYGSVGLGKTHLAQAIGNEVLKTQPDLNVLYVTSDKFTNQVIHAIKNNTIENFLNFYHMIDVLIIDDIQFFTKKMKTQDIFFNIFNQLHQRRKQLIFTSDRRPQDLVDIQERLISRFTWGLSADLGIPDLETRMAILETKMSKEGIDITPEVSEFICFHIKNNIRELEGAMVSLIAHASFGKDVIDLNIAKKVVQKFVRELNNEITVEFIQKSVADHFKIPIEKLSSKTRKRAVVIARQLAMYLSKKLTSQSLKAIGAFFGGKDHSTVIYSCTAIENLMTTDELFKLTVEELEKKIKMSVNQI